MKLKNYLFAGLVGMLAVLSSCTDKNYTIIEGGNTYIFSDYPKIQFDPIKNWNAEYGRFEYSVEYNDLIDDIYDYGVVIAHLYIEDGGVEVLRNLPFIQDKVDAGGAYTERISYDITPGYITFFIEFSDKKKRNSAILNELNQKLQFEFKVVVLWDGIEE